MDCLFCNIVNKKISADIVFENDQVLAFRDINPQAPVHILVIPKKHISTINDTQNDDEALLGNMMITAKNIAKQENISDDGYRLAINCNDNGGQTVYHIHMHILGGRQMDWPPG